MAGKQQSTGSSTWPRAEQTGRVGPHGSVLFPIRVSVGGLRSQELSRQLIHQPVVLTTAVPAPVWQWYGQLAGGAVSASDKLCHRLFKQPSSSARPRT
eukprot:357558-Chlamydomonas_euryale.AAC.1